jgi:hypothetical protein
VFSGRIDSVWDSTNFTLRYTRNPPLSRRSSAITFWKDAIVAGPVAGAAGSAGAAGAAHSAAARAADAAAAACSPRPCQRLRHRGYVWGRRRHRLYLPPQICNGEGYQMSVNLWARGVVGSVMLAGKFPFYGGTRRASKVIDYYYGVDE